MNRRRSFIQLCCTLLVPGCLLAFPARALELEQSQLDHEQNRLRYALVTQTNGDFAALGSGEAFDADEGGATVSDGRKSPAKAFVLSLLVPGAGQFYAGSRIRPFVYLGIEAAAWGLHAKYHAEGNDKTDEFQMFSQTHWSRDTYTDYITWTYGHADDEDVPIDSFPEFTHHLPSTNTQQYYEMTGKYDQFAWGWDDAALNGMTIDSFGVSNPPPRFVPDANVPVSRNRDAYETMRDLANKEFNKATNMLMLALANHVVSAFEAFISTKSHNNKVTEKEAFGRSDGGFLSSIRVKPSLKSIHSKRDTPYVKVTYKF